MTWTPVLNNGQHSHIIENSINVYKIAYLAHCLQPPAKMQGFRLLLCSAVVHIWNGTKTQDVVRRGNNHLDGGVCH